MGNFALLLSGQGKLDEAEPLMIEAVGARRATLGDRHPHTLNSIGNLVDLLREAGKLAEAQAALGDTVATTVAVLGESHLTSMVIAAKAARLRHAQDGGQVEGKAMLSAAVARMADVLGPEHPQTCKYKAALGVMA